MFDTAFAWISFNIKYYVLLHSHTMALPFNMDVISFTYLVAFSIIASCYVYIRLFSIRQIGENTYIADMRPHDITR